ncbi:MAG: sulfotransferase family protein [Rhodanobacter sp.]|nr:MAG: sulfotransferase family protein [Rhodanobacter sp.]
MTTYSTQEVFAALQGGQFGSAERLARQQLRQRPQDQDLLLLLAVSLREQQKPDQALAIFAELTELQPDNAVHWGNYATALRDTGAMTEAEAAYTTSLKLAPDNAEQWFNLGLLKLQGQDYLGAREALLNAFANDPQSPVIRIHAARACSACRDDHRVDELLKPWRHWVPLDAELQFELASLLLALGEANTVKELLEDTLRIDPFHLKAKLLLGSVYERVNRLQDAENLLQEIITAHPDPDEHVRLEIAHQQATLAQRQGDLATARAILERVGPRNPGDYAHYYVLAGVCDKLGDLSAALQALEKAHASQLEEMRVVVPYRFAPDAPVLPTAVTRVSETDYRQWPKLSAPDASQSPVFIVGFPRSGTTLLEQMLDAHPRLQSMDERPFFNILVDQLANQDFQFPQDLHKLDQRDCDELRKAYVSMACSKVPRRWDTQLVDKNPMNMLWLPMMHRLFPEAKIILALRHPCDVILSNYMQNFRSTVLAMACSTIERLATAYVTAMECWLEHAAVFNTNVFISRYEDLVANTAERTRQIADFIGIEDATPMLNFDQHARDKGYIATPSYAQVIVPVNRKGLNRWVRYREALEPALPILQPMLDHWGYSVD